MKQVAKTVADKARQAAIQTTKQVGHELLEIPKQTVAEAVGVKPPGTEASDENTQQPKPQSSNTPDPQVQQRLDYLEKELEELKAKRQQEKREQEYLEIQKKQQEEEEKQKRMQEIFEPPKKKLRMPGFSGKGPKGTGEKIKTSK